MTSKNGSLRKRVERYVQSKGLVTDHIFPEDNEPEGVESIILDGTLELTKSEIAGIAQIER